MPPVNEEMIPFFKSYTNIFTGEHEKVLKEITSPEGQVLKPMTELDRLAYIVNEIENDTHIIPVGAFKMKPTHEIRKNIEFEWIKSDAITNIKSYCHFRKVMDQEKKDLIDREDALSDPNFLDEISKDLPKSSWALVLDHTKTIVHIRSLKWIGYIAFHKCHTNIFGGIYVGDGLPNPDLAFML